MNKITRIFLSIITISICSSMHWETHSAIPMTKESTKQTALEKEPWVTIFIHGTMCVEKLLTIETLLTLLRRSIENSRYQRLLHALRQKPYSYTAQAAQLPGLRPINITHTPSNSAELFTHLYKVVQERYFPDEITVEWLTFGWSGAMNHLERLWESQNLIDALTDYLEQKRKIFPNLKVRLVTYSHGSNIALNIAHLNPGNLQIDQLIMLGTPVFAENEICIYSPIFKEIFSIYSRHDTASLLDIFSTNGSFPRRRFHKKNRLHFPPNFKQIEIEFKLTAKNDPKKHNHSNRTIEKSPGHLEMWIFGWPNLTTFCRRNFPLSPLPAALIVPAIIAHMKANPELDTDQVFSYKTDEGLAYTRKRFSSEKTYFQFIEPEFIGAMQSCAWNFWQNDMSPIEKDAINQKCEGILSSLLANR